MYQKLEKKGEEESGGLLKATKTSALQEARAFNEIPVNVKKCINILTKLVYLLNQGDTFTTQEATDAFFNLTRLFQCKDQTLRRLVYLGIKDLSGIAENVYVVTSSLTQDMNSKDDLCRPSAMRALITITDSTTFQGIERYMKQGIVDKNPALQSAALVSSLHLSKTLPEGIKRWSNEAQEAVTSSNNMVQHHALGLLYHIRKSDKLAVNKMVTKFVNSGLKSPLAICFLIRVASKIVQDEDEGDAGPFFDFMHSCLRNKSELVAYEAANCMVHCKHISNKDLALAISVLQTFLASGKATWRFAACRTLNKVASIMPNAVTACNVDLENLITDSNRSIATLAITTLLKTGNESGVDRLFKQIGSFMGDISDEFKIVVVSATKQLCSKFPAKHDVVMQYLSSWLREDGGFEYKKAIVSTLIEISCEFPDSKEEALTHLCDFIEDCEHNSLIIQVLHLLGREGPSTSRPSQYIRCIYNRLILETPKVKPAAVSALARFGAKRPELLPSVMVLLQRAALDTDDEVRDRAVYFLHILRTQQKQYYTSMILNPLQVSLVQLESSLQHYLAQTDEPDDPFDITMMEATDVPVPDTVSSKGSQADKGPSTIGFQPVTTTSGQVDVNKESLTRGDMFTHQLGQIPQLAALNMGPLFKSCDAIELTESETEYVVQCVKHVFQHHLVLQFDITNTCSDQLLEQVSVRFKVPEGMEQVAKVSCPFIGYNATGSTYCVLGLVDEDQDLGSILSTLEDVTLVFRVKDCDQVTQMVDPDEVGYDDEYSLEDVDIGLVDLMKKVSKGDFNLAWDELGEDTEVEEVYQLCNFKSIEEAVKNIVPYLGMYPCDRSDRMAATTNGRPLPSHTVILSGLFIPYEPTHVLVKARLAINLNDIESGVTMKISVRSNNPNVSSFIATSVA